jgi:hypothetical protein
LGAAFLKAGDTAALKDSAKLEEKYQGTPCLGSVFISKRIGWARCPVRFNCPPEIAVRVVSQSG